MVPLPPQDDKGPDFTPMNLAMEWVSRVLSMSVVMVGPILGGVWLDHRLGTHWITPVAAVVGLVVGIAYLLLLTARPASSRTERQGRPPTGGSGPRNED